MVKAKGCFEMLGEKRRELNVRSEAGEPKMVTHDEFRVKFERFKREIGNWSQENLKTVS